MSKKSIEDEIKTDIIEAIMDTFQPTDFGYEVDGEDLIATEYRGEGDVFAKYKVTLTVGIEEI